MSDLYIDFLNRCHASWRLIAVRKAQTQNRFYLSPWKRQDHEVRKQEFFYWIPWRSLHKQNNNRHFSDKQSRDKCKMVNWVILFVVWELNAITFNKKLTFTRNSVASHKKLLNIFPIKQLSSSSALKFIILTEIEMHAKHRNDVGINSKL